MLIRRKDGITQIGHKDDSFGLFIFAFIPRKCRDGKYRFGWLEKFDDGTYIRSRL